MEFVFLWDKTLDLNRDLWHREEIENGENEVESKEVNEVFGICISLFRFGSRERRNWKLWKDNNEIGKQEKRGKWKPGEGLVLIPGSLLPAICGCLCFQHHLWVPPEWITRAHQVHQSLWPQSWIKIAVAIYNRPKNNLYLQPSHFQLV